MVKSVKNKFNNLMMSFCMNCNLQVLVQFKKITVLKSNAKVTKVSFLLSS